MSWAPKNLFNLYQRTVGSKKKDITFSYTRSTLFQQRWKSKAVVRAYHGDYINEKIFKRWYLPETLPDVRPRRQILGDDKGSLEEFALRRKKEKDEEEVVAEKGLAPVGSLMFSEVERRIDVFIFRCCFAHSIYEARRLVIHGDVLLNGKKHQDANTRLAPGDMVSVNPDAIRFFKRPNGAYDDVNGYERLLARHKERLENEAQQENFSWDSEASATPAEMELVTKMTEQRAAEEPNAAESFSEEQNDDFDLTPFYLPLYASPWLFIPAYIEVSFATCSAIYVRHPTARPGYSEIPTPYPADGEIVRFAWEWYVKRRPRVRSKSQLARMPEDRALSLVEDINLSRRNLKRDVEKMKAARVM